MAEQLTFANYGYTTHALADIYDIGGGVIPEMAEAFRHPLTPRPDVDNLGQLIATVGPAKELQENISRVQDALGTNDDATGIARGWVERSGLLTPVFRAYGDAAPNIPRDYDVALVTGGVRNWMQRRADRLIQARSTTQIGHIILIAGARVMRPQEGADVAEAMTEADYMRVVIGSKLAQAGFSEVSALKVDTTIGDKVAAAAAAHIRKDHTAVLVASNAGAWVQNTGQLWRAIRERQSSFDMDYPQMYVTADEFPLGTGAEPTATHQNPFSALGQIVRNAQELARVRSGA